MELIEGNVCDVTSGEPIRREESDLPGPVGVGRVSMSSVSSDPDPIRRVFRSKAMRRRGMWWYGLALGGLASVSLSASVGAQTQASGTAGLGLGYLAIPQFSGGGTGAGQSGLAIVPMATSTASTSATPAGRAAALSSDPLGF